MDASPDAGPASHAAAPACRTWLRARARAAVLAAAAVVSPCGLAQPDVFPTRAVSLVSPYPPGGGVDIVARALREPLQRGLGQPVEISYRTGQAAAVGTAFVANAAPDGYTILIGAASTVVIPELDRLFERPRSYALEQLVPVAVLTNDTPLLVVHPSLQVKNAREFIELARSRPGEVAVSNGVHYGPSHLPMLMLERAAGVRFRHLMGSGGGPAMSAVLSGNAVAFAGVPSVVARHLAAGRVRALAQWGARRLDAFPDVPTFQELGIDVEYHDWFAVFAPARTPPAALAVLRAALQKAVLEPDFLAAMAEANQPIAYLDGDALKTWYARESRQRVEAVRAIGRIETKIETK